MERKWLTVTKELEELKDKEKLEDIKKSLSHSPNIIKTVASLIALLEKFPSENSFNIRVFPKDDKFGNTLNIDKLFCYWNDVYVDTSIVPNSVIEVKG